MYCRFCGKKIDEDSSFCRYCGKQIIIDRTTALNNKNTGSDHLSVNKEVSLTKKENSLTDIHDIITSTNKTNSLIQSNNNQKHPIEEKSKYDKYIIYFFIAILGGVVLYAGIMNPATRTSFIVIASGCLALLLGFLIKSKGKTKEIDIKRLYKLSGNESSCHTVNSTGVNYIDTGISIPLSQISKEILNSKYVYEYVNATIQYQFFVILNIPILPLDCHLVHAPFKSTSTSYTICAGCHTKGTEILGIYLRRWGFLAILIGLLLLFT